MKKTHAYLLKQDGDRWVGGLQPPPFDLMDPRVELFGNIWLA